MLFTFWRMSADLGNTRARTRTVRGVTVRPGRGSRDAADIAKLYGQAFDDEPWPETWTRFESYDPDGVLVAESADGLVAFLVSYPRGDGGYISVVATAPAHRRRGIARALITQALTRFRALGFRKATVDVRATNAPAIGCYESLGFRKLGEFQADEHCREPTSHQSRRPRHNRTIGG